MKKTKIPIYSIVIVLLGVISVFVYQKTNITREMAFEKQKNDAALKGLGWIISHKDSLSPDEAVWYFKTFYKIVPDRKLSQELLTIVKEKEKAIPKIDTDIDIKNKKYQNPNNLLLVVKELLRRKCSGKDYVNDAQKVRQIVGKSPPSRDVEYLYLLKELGIDDKNYYKRVVSDNLSLFTSPAPQGQIQIGDSYLYNITHIVLNESDYFSHYLDPKEYQQEVRILNNSLDRLSSSPKALRDNVDILSEVLFSLKLFRQRPSEKIDKIYQGLINIQNSDGSWEQTNSNSNVKVHNTIVASIALFSFPADLRKGKIYCSSY